MASIYQRTNNNGTKVWRAVIRLKGHPTVCEHFDRKQEAEDWAREMEQQIKRGKYSSNQTKQKKTVTELIDIYIQDAVIGHHKAANDTVRQLKLLSGKNWRLCTDVHYSRPSPKRIDRKKNHNKKLKYLLNMFYQ